MRDADAWTESKYVMRRGRLVASRDRAELGVASRLIAGRVAALYQQHLPAYASGRLADLGCGKVPLYGAYRNLVDEVVCVDWPQSLHGARHVDVEADLTQPLPFDDGRFDTIVLSDVLEHMPHPQPLWDEMSRLLAPGGCAIVNLPFLYGVHEAPHDYARYTRYALQRFAEHAGFDVRVMEPLGGSLHVLADLLAKHFAQLPLLGAPLAIAAQGVVSLLDRTPAGRRLAARTAERFPLGHFVVAQRA